MLRFEAINHMNREQFVAALAGVFEHSPWIADRAWAARPFESLDGLHRAMTDAVKEATAEEQLRLLRAHPELAGKEARERSMTADSAAEQGSAGLDHMPAAEYARFDRLNASYRKAFGFPFIIAVRDRSREAIISEFERRLQSDRATEMKTALDEVFSIAKMRLSRLFREQLSCTAPEGE